MKGAFITGTDTGCGKTEVSLGLIQALQQQGLRVQGIKPVASGCERTDVGLRNADARRLRHQSTRQVPYESVNPYAFEPAIAPQIAAGQCGVDIELSIIRECAEALAAQSDFLVMEGVGGWRVPLSRRLYVSDLPRHLGLPVVMVTGLKLGCINHSLLTVESIRACGSRLAGWVANQLEPNMQVPEENLATLASLIDAPFLGLVPWMPDPQPGPVADQLRLAPLMGNVGHLRLG
jgi:dethiobiotin synthetase